MMGPAPGPVPGPRARVARDADAGRRACAEYLRKFSHLTSADGANKLAHVTQEAIAIDAEPPAPDVQVLCQLMGQADYCILPGLAMNLLLRRRDRSALLDWEAFQGSWSRLEVDGYMAGGERYRRRRHATLSAQQACSTFRVEPHRERVTHDPLDGGVERHVAQIEDEILSGETMTSILSLAREVFGRLSPSCNWHIDVHPLRVEMEDSEVVRPTPEGTHRNGVSFVMMILIDRANVGGGATTLVDAEGNLRDSFTLVEPLATAIANDERLRHGVTPTCQLDIDCPASRDTLAITFRPVCDAATRP